MSPPKPSWPSQPTGSGSFGRFKLSESEGVLVVSNAIRLLGTKYKFGGENPREGFDCSGFIGYCYSVSANIRAPRTVREMQIWANPIGRGAERPGDLVFFGSGSVATHAGICRGNGRFIHSPSTGGKVREEGFVSGHWRQQLIGFGRP